MSEIVNYDEIKDSLRLILSYRKTLSVEERERIIGELSDALANNADRLVLYEDIEE